MRMLALTVVVLLNGSATADRAAPKWVAYLLTGHGEANDPDSIPSDLKPRLPERRTTKLVEKLDAMGFRVEKLGIVELANQVPDDASVVVILAPTTPLQPAEWAYLGTYLDRGGALLVALDPSGEPALGMLGAKLGVKVAPGRVVDDKAFLPARGTLTDRRNTVTNQFSAHPSTATLAKGSASLVVVDGGALETVPFASKPAPTQTVTLRTMESSWLDLNANDTFDAKTESRQRRPLAIAVEAKFRALVFADVDLFVDLLTSTAGAKPVVTLASAPLLEDSIRWLIKSP